MNPEPVLLVDHRQPESIEMNAFLDQGVGAHRNIDFPGGDPPDQIVALRRARRPEVHLCVVGRQESKGHLMLAGFLYEQ